MADEPYGFSRSCRAPANQASAPQPLDPNAQVTPETASAIITAFDKATGNWAKNDGANLFASPTDAELQRHLQAKIRAIAGEGATPPTNAQLKQSLLTLLDAASFDPRTHLFGASGAVTSEGNLPKVKGVFRRAFGAAISKYEEIVEGKAPQRGGRA